MKEEYITIRYAKEKGDLKDNSFVKQRERGFNSRILYGIYDHETMVFKISYHKESHFTPLDESKTINDVNVEYQNSVNNTFEVSFTSDKGTYETQFNLNEIAKEEAFEIIDIITSHINH